MSETPAVSKLSIVRRAAEGLDGKTAARFVQISRMAVERFGSPVTRERVLELAEDLRERGLDASELIAYADSLGRGPAGS